MKKLLSIMLAALIALSCLVVPVYAEGPLEFSLVITSGEYKNGVDDVITAEIRIANNENGHLGANIYIDLPESLQLADEEYPDECIVPTSLLPRSAQFLSGRAADGENRISIAWMHTRTITGNGAICTIDLVVRDGATSTDNFDIKLGMRQVKISDEMGEIFADDPDANQYVTFPEAATEVEIGECQHPETEKVEAKPATCTEPGYSAGEKCKFCGEPIGETEQKQPLGHDFQKDHTIEEPNCTKTGKDLYKCTRCGETEERETPKKEHVKSEDYKSDGTSHWLYCVNCGAEIEGTKKAHEPDAAWHNEDASVDGHYHVCSVCKAAVGVEEHVDDDADGECDVCEAALHEHEADTSKWIPDEEGVYHYHACTVPGCKAQLDKEAHKLETKTDKEATCTEKGSETTYCTVCDYKETKETEMIPHTPDTEWHTEKGSDMHWHICTVCGNKIEDTAVAHTYGEYTSTETEHTHTCTACGASETEKHSGGKATCVKGAVCEACGKEYGELDPDNHADGLTGVEWENDENGHWQTCKNCGKTTEPAEHKKADDYKTDGENHWSYCTVCGYEYEKTAHATTKGLTSDSTGHWKTCDECEAKFEFDPHTKAILVSEKEATAEADGNTEYWYCPDCQKYFYNDNGKIGKGPYDNADEFTVKFKQTCQGNHDFICVPVNDAYHKFVCRRCGYSISTQHDIAANGLCFYCGHMSTTVNTNTGVVEVESPTEFKISAETLEIVR